MKRIIEGMTYNTETSSTVFSDMIWGRNGDGSRTMEHVNGEHSLEVSRHGAFFIHEVIYHPNQHGDGHEQIIPIDDSQARKWLEANAAEKPELIEEFFGKQPEAGSNEARISLRVSAVLKRRIDHRRGSDSVNAFIVQAVEEKLRSMAVRSILDGET